MTLELREGLLVAERFCLVRELGKGGMGSVWLARHTGLDVHCAVKFIDQHGRDSAEMRARFEREAKSAAQLRSPNVVQILDYGVWNDAPYIAMEYLEGEDLAARLEAQWVLSPEATFQIVSQVSRALTRAHAAGIVHRDLKPENIFLAKDGDEEVAKVLDFGIAKSASLMLTESGTKTGSLLGTPFYMSPEQARGVKAIDHRSDLWSLAVITYECVVGQLPFESEGLGDVLAKIMYEAIPVPSEVNPGLPPAFDEWWRRAAARKPEERFQSAKELADELAQALGLHRVPQATTSGLSLSSSLPEAGSLLAGSAPPPVREARPNQTTVAVDTGSPLARSFVQAPPNPGPRRMWVAAGIGTLGIIALGGIALSWPRDPKPSRISGAATSAPPVSSEVPAAEPAGPASAGKPGEVLHEQPPSGPERTAPEQSPPIVQGEPSAESPVAATPRKTPPAAARPTPRATPTQKVPAQKVPAKATPRKPIDFGI